MVPLLSFFIFHLSSFGVAAFAAAVSQPAPRPALARVEAVPPSGSVPAGSRIELVVRVTPKPRIHIYAPGEKRYKPVLLTIDGIDGVRPGKPIFPESTWGTFEGERVRIYDRAFDIRQPIEVLAPPGTAVQVRATLEYQACDDLMCYLPIKVPLRWDVSVR
jgi:DsbC/DsbD-like thiol-disulfide interchange protein